MLLLALLAVALLFGLAFIGRVGGARRKLLIARWPALVFAGAALLMAARGALWPTIWFALTAVIVWFAMPSLRRPAPSQVAPEGPAEREARAVLGVRPNASDAEIRRAYRDKMARAHPDKGGSHNEAARLTAARDRLLKRKGRRP